MVTAKVAVSTGLATEHERGGEREARGRGGGRRVAVSTGLATEHERDGVG